MKAQVAYSSFTMKQRKGMCWANTLKDSNINISQQLFLVHAEEFKFFVFLLPELMSTLYYPLHSKTQTNKQTNNDWTLDLLNDNHNFHCRLSNWYLGFLPFPPHWCHKEGKKRRDPASEVCKLLSRKDIKADNFKFILVTVCLTVYWSCEIYIIDQVPGQDDWILTTYFFKFL